MTTKITLKDHKLRKFIFQILNKIRSQTAERIFILNYEIPFYEKMVYALHSLPNIFYDSPLNFFYELNGKLNFGKSILYYSFDSSPINCSSADCNKFNNYRVKNSYFQQSKKYSTNHNTRHAAMKTSGITIGVKDVKYLRKHNEIIIYHSSDEKENIFDNSEKGNSVDITSRIHCLDEKTHIKKFINENNFDIKSKEKNCNTKKSKMRVSKDNNAAQVLKKNKNIKSEFKNNSEVMKLPNLSYQSELKKMISSFSSSRFLNWTNCIQSINKENSNHFISKNNDRSRVILYLKLYPIVLHLHNVLADPNTGSGKWFYGTHPQDQLDIDEFVRKTQILDETYVKDDEEDYNMINSSLKRPSHPTSVNQQTLKVFKRKIHSEYNFSDDSTESYSEKNETIDSEDTSLGQEMLDDKNNSKNDSFGLSKSLSLHKDVLNQMKQLTQLHEKSIKTQLNSNIVYDLILEKIKIKHDVPKDDNENKIKNKSYSISLLTKDKNTDNFSPEKKISDDQIKICDDSSNKLNIETEKNIISKDKNEINYLNVRESTNERKITDLKSPKWTNLNQFKKIETEKPETPSNYSESGLKKVELKFKNKLLNLKTRKHENKFYDFYERNFNNKLKPGHKKKPVDYESIVVIPLINDAGNFEVFNPERKNSVSFKTENAKFVQKNFIEEGQKISKNTEDVKESINVELKNHTNSLSNNCPDQNPKTAIAKNEEKLIQPLENNKEIIKKETKPQRSEHDFASKSIESINTRPPVFSMDAPSHEGVQLGKIKSVKEPSEESTKIFVPWDQSQILTETLQRFQRQKNNLHSSKTISSLTSSLSSQNMNRNVSRIVEEIEQDENSSTGNNKNNLFQIAQGTKKDLQYMNYFKNRFQNRG